MDDLRNKLISHRRRVRLGRAAEDVARAAFWTSLAACAWLVAEKIGGFAVPRAPAAAVLVGVPLALGLRAWARSFTLRDCAVHLDRRLGLDERLATALEASGPMAGAVASDAASALSRATLPPRRLPREARLLAGSGLLMAALLSMPAPRVSSAAQENPALEALGEEALRKLESLANARIEFKEARALLEEGRLEEALRKYEALREALAEKLLEGGGAETETMQEAADAAARAVAARLQKMGKVVHAPRPRSLDLKMERQAVEASGPSGGRTAGRAVDLRGDWPPRYDAIIRRYDLLRRIP